MLLYNMKVLCSKILEQFRMCVSSTQHIFLYVGAQEKWLMKRTDGRRQTADGGLSSKTNFLSIQLKYQGNLIFHSIRFNIHFL